MLIDKQLQKCQLSWRFALTDFVYGIHEIPCTFTMAVNIRGESSLTWLGGQIFSFGVSKQTHSLGSYFQKYIHEVPGT